MLTCPECGSNHMELIEDNMAVCRDCSFIGDVQNGEVLKVIDVDDSGT